MGCQGCLSLVLSILLPPLGVLIRRGLGVDLLLSFVLTLMGYFPGVIHAVWVIAQAEAERDR
jgi:uncharacterized membrane protein YqaE (UPF0057 family)